jgi:hypothetical protein
MITTHVRDLVAHDASGIECASKLWKKATELNPETRVIPYTTDHASLGDFGTECLGNLLAPDCLQAILMSRFLHAQIVDVEVGHIADNLVRSFSYQAMTGGGLMEYLKN